MNPLENRIFTNMENLPLPAPNKFAFHFEGDGPTILLFHGFTGTPYELRPLAQYLNQAGQYNCIAPLLPGHGENTKALNQVTYSDWLKCAEDTIKAQDPKKKLIVLGFSMGGLIASHLAITHPHQVDKLVLLAPAFYLHMLPALGAFAAKMGVRHVLPQVSKYGGCDVGDPEAKEKNPTLAGIPAHALVELELLRERVLSEIHILKTKTYCALARHDKTISSPKVEKLLEAFSNVTLTYYEQSRHIIGLDFERALLAKNVLEFVK